MPSTNVQAHFGIRYAQLNATEGEKRLNSSKQMRFDCVLQSYAAIRAYDFFSSESYSIHWEKIVTKTYILQYEATLVGLKMK